MPYLQTDVEAGQKAALNMELEPLRAQAETQKLQSQMQVQPYKTQADIGKLQSTIQTQELRTEDDIATLRAHMGNIPTENELKKQQVRANNLTFQKGALELAETIKNISEDTNIKNKFIELAKSPEWATLSPEAKFEKAANTLDESGNFDAATKIREKSAKYLQSKASTLKATGDYKDSQLGEVHRLTEGLSPDGSNVDTVILGLRSSGAMKPEEEKIYEDNLKAVAATKDPAKIEAFKKQMAKTYNDIAGKKAITDSEKIAAAERKADKDRDARERKEDSVNNRFIAALVAKDENVIKSVALKAYDDAAALIPRYTRELHNAQKDLAALPPVPTSRFGKAEDPNADARKGLTDTIADIKVDIEDAKGRMKRFGGYLPKGMAEDINRANKPDEPKSDPKDVDIPIATDQKDFDKKYASGKPVIGLDGKKYTKPEDKNTTSKTDKPKVKPQGQEQGWDFTDKTSLEYVLKDLTTNPKYEDRDFVIHKGRYFVKDSSKKEGYREAPASNYYDSSKEPKKKVTN